MKVLEGKMGKQSGGTRSDGIRGGHQGRASAGCGNAQGQTTPKPQGQTTPDGDEQTPAQVDDCDVAASGDGTGYQRRDVVEGHQAGVAVVAVEKGRGDKAGAYICDGYAEMLYV